MADASAPVDATTSLSSSLQSFSFSLGNSTAGSSNTSDNKEISAAVETVDVPVPPADEATQAADKALEHTFVGGDGLNKDETMQFSEDAPGLKDVLADEKVTWEGLGVPAGILENFKKENPPWVRPSKVQGAVLGARRHPLTKESHLVVMSPNGTGKTGAFAAALLSFLDPNIKAVQAIILAPTRDLVLQTAARIGNLIQNTPFTISSMLGKSDELYRDITSSIVVATAGKIASACIQSQQSSTMRGMGRNTGPSRFTPAFDLKTVKYVVLDEADEIITSMSSDTRPGAQEDPVIRIKKACNPSTYFFLFSASFECFEADFMPQKPQMRERIARNVRTLLDGRPHFMISVDSPLCAETVTYFWSKLPAPANLNMLSPEDKNSTVFYSKATYLWHVLKSTGCKAVVFVNTHIKGALLARFLQEKGGLVVSTAVNPESGGPKLTGDAALAKQKKIIEDRKKNLQDFNTGVTKILICTDAIARGIDVQGLQLSVNFEFPRFFGVEENAVDRLDRAKFQHRCGRVGRFGRIGTVLNITMLPWEEKEMEELSTRFQKPMRYLPIGQADADKVSKLVMESIKREPKKQIEVVKEPEYTPPHRDLPTPAQSLKSILNKK